MDVARPISARQILAIIDEVLLVHLISKLDGKVGEAVKDWQQFYVVDVWIDGAHEYVEGVG
jgi:hypothetical protein